MIETKTCKQCGKEKSIDLFRKYKPTGRGAYATKQGHNTICRECETFNMSAHNAMQRDDTAMMDDLRQHYRYLAMQGFPPITAAARRLMGETVAPRQRGYKGGSALAKEKASIEGIPPYLLEHVAMVKGRRYVSFAEAEIKHKDFIVQLKDAGLYEEAQNAIDEWWDED